jgi:hypothetical protein
MLCLSKRVFFLRSSNRLNGFSLHANTSTNTLARDSLRKLVEYISCGPLFIERLEVTKSGQVKLKLKTAYSDGTFHLLFTTGEFIEKLSAIIPAPKSHLVKWSGVFEPGSPCREKVVLKPEVKKGRSPKNACTEDIPLKKSSWSKILAKFFEFDVTQYQQCKGDIPAQTRLDIDLRIAVLKCKSSLLKG